MPAPSTDLTRERLQRRDCKTHFSEQVRPVDEYDLLLMWGVLFVVIMGASAFVGHDGMHWFDRR